MPSCTTKNSPISERFAELTILEFARKWAGETRETGVLPEQVPILAAEIEPIVLEMTASRDCYVTVLNIHSDGQVSLLFPNHWDTDNRIKSDAVVTVPGAHFRSQLMATEPAGRDTIIAVVSSRPWPELELVESNSKAVMATLTTGQVRNVVAGALTIAGALPLLLAPQLGFWRAIGVSAGVGLAWLATLIGRWEERRAS